MRLSTTLAIVLAVTLLAGQETSARAITAPDLAAGSLGLGTVLLVPPRAEMVKRRVGADDSMIEESHELERAAVANTTSVLEQKGYRVLTLSAADIEADLDLQDLLRQVNSRFDEEYAQIAKRPGKIKMNRYSMGDEARLLAEYLDADAIAFQRIIMEVAAPGQMAMAFLVGGSAGGSRLDLTLVNGSDGRVLAFYDAALGIIGEERAETEAEEMIQKLTKRALKKLPESTGETDSGKDKADEETLDELELLLED